MRLRVRALALALALPASAIAHAVEDPRVLVLVVGKDSLELRVNEVTPVADSEVLRRRFDGDRNGVLDAAEQTDLTAFLAARATKSLAVEERGKGLALVLKSRVLRGAVERVDSTEPLSVDVILVAKPAGREVVLTVKDRRPDDHAVRVAVSATEVTLLDASAGEVDAKRGLVTGVRLDRTSALTLRYRR